MGALEVTEARVAIDEAVALLELVGIGVGVTMVALERSQLNGDLLGGGGGGGCGTVVGGVGSAGGEGGTSGTRGFPEVAPLEVVVEP